MLDDSDWRTLVESLDKETCVLFLGPEVSREGAADDADTLVRTLSQHLCQGLKPPPGDPGYLAHVAKRRLLEGRSGERRPYARNDLELDVAAFYEERSIAPSPIHDDLAALPFRLIITSCHDQLLRAAYDRRGGSPHLEYYHFKGEKRDPCKTGSRERPLIYHLYGSIVDPSSLVLTEDDTLSLLVSVIAGDPGLPASLLTELRRANVTFLFLGFGIAHWYLRILLHVLNSDSKRKLMQREYRSFALDELLPVPEDSAEFKQILLFYTDPYQIVVHRDRLRPFVTDLRRRYDTRRRRPTVPPDAEAPKVFISYTHEDRDAASEVFRLLRDQGLQPWMDRERLTAGDRWDPEIARIIDGADYFVSLQSPALCQRVVAYVNEEIALATRRALRFRPSATRFLIPLRVTECELVPEVREYQAISWSDDRDLSRLASLLKEDFKARERGRFGST